MKIEKYSINVWKNFDYWQMVKKVELTNEKDISFIENRITKLMHGGSETKSSIPFFKNKSNMGVEQNIQLSLIKLKIKS